MLASENNTSLQKLSTHHQHRRSDPGPSGRAAEHDDLPGVVEDDSWRHAGERALARRYEVGWGRRNAEGVV